MLGKAVELAPRLRGAARVQVNRGERDAPGGHRRELIGELAHGVLELAQPPLAHAQPEQLGAGEDRHRGVLQAPAERDALVDELLGVLEAPRDHRPAGAVQRDVGAGARIARVGGDPVQRLDRHVGAGQVVELEQQVDLPGVRADGELGVADVVGEREQLVRPCEAALRRVGPAGRDVPLVEHVGERRRVVELARDAQRLGHEVLAPLDRVGVVERHGEAHEKPRAQRAGAGADALQRLLECRHEDVVDHARRQAEAAEAQGRAGEQVAVADAPREVDGRQQRRARRVAARLHLRLAAQEQQLAAPAIVGLAQHVECRQGGVEQVRRALVGQRREGLVPRALGVIERLARIADRRGLDEVVGQLGLAGRSALERVAHRAVQPRPAGRGQVAVERLADQPVREAERARGPGRLLDELHGQRVVEALEQLGPCDAGDALQGP